MLSPVREKKPNLAHGPNKMKRLRCEGTLETSVDLKSNVIIKI
jgi:hypothetical protein